MRKNDEKIAKFIQERFMNANVVCDDGNVHVKFPSNHKIDAESCEEEYGGRETSDGVQEGRVIVWLGEEMLTNI